MTALSQARGGTKLEGYAGIYTPMRKRTATSYSLRLSVYPAASFVSGDFCARRGVTPIEAQIWSWRNKLLSRAWRVVD